MLFVGDVGDIRLRDPDVASADPGNAARDEEHREIRRPGEQQVADEPDRLRDQNHRLTTQAIAERTPDRRRDDGADCHRCQECANEDAACAIPLREVRQQRYHDEIADDVDQRDGVDRHQSRDHRFAVHASCLHSALPARPPAFREGVVIRITARHHAPHKEAYAQMAAGKVDRCRLRS
jgi:hypothetical protein